MWTQWSGLSSVPQIHSWLVWHTWQLSVQPCATKGTEGDLCRTTLGRHTSTARPDESSGQIGKWKYEYRGADSPTTCQYANRYVRYSIGLLDRNNTRTNWYRWYCPPTDSGYSKSGKQSSKSFLAEARAIANTAGNDLISECETYKQTIGLLPTASVIYTMAGRLRPRI